MSSFFSQPQRGRGSCPLYKMLMQTAAPAPLRGMNHAFRFSGAGGLSEPVPSTSSVNLMKSGEKWQALRPRARLALKEDRREQVPGTGRGAEPPSCEAAGGCGSGRDTQDKPSARLGRARRTCARTVPTRSHLGGFSGFFHSFLLNLS